MHHPAPRHPRLDPLADRYAARTHGMKTSEIRALFSVVSRPEVVSLAGGMPAVTALPLDAVGSMIGELVSGMGAQTLQYGSGQGDPRLRERICDVMALEGITDASPSEVVVRTGLLDLGSHPKTWDLLRMTRMPAVRLDCGYLSHPVDRLLLLDARLRSTVASAVLAAVQRLFLPAEADPPTGTFVLPGRT